MPVNTTELLHAAADLAEQENLKVSVKESAKGAAICGSSCFVGGLLAGPVGLAIGGAVGGLSAAYFAKGFKPVHLVIRNDLTDAQKQKLYDHIVKALRDIDITDLAILLPVLMGSASAQMAILNTVRSFVTQQMNLQIID